MLQVKGFLGEFGLEQDSMTAIDSLSASGSYYLSAVDTVAKADTIISKVYPDTLTYTLSDSLFQKFIKPSYFENLTEGIYNFNFIPKNQFVENWAILLLVFLLILIVTVVVSSEKYLVQLFQSIFNRVVANRLFKERFGSLLEGAYRLDILFFLVAGLFAYQAVNIFGGSESSILIYGACLGAVFVWIVGKFLIYRLTGLIFDTSSETREYIFYLKSGNRVLGLLLLPIAISLFFVKSNFAVLLFVFGAILIVFFVILGLYRGIKVIGQKVFSIYYMILYLCTLEILPLIYVWRILWRE